jgi:adenine/guanine phosphoribosyltransferase-like PRPP-binding protein
MCILVDDVLTTGATLAAVERALERRGHDVLGATVLAATPAPGTRGADRSAGAHRVKATYRSEPQSVTDLCRLVHR